MPTQCIQAALDLGRAGDRDLVGAFDGGAIKPDDGMALLAGADRKRRLAERLAACFTDHRCAEAISHTLPDLLRQRMLGLALGARISSTTTLCVSIRRDVITMR